jgi:ADP-heptose:LPS heptosyltransferase/SAM-dependent methyltransferase
MMRPVESKGPPPASAENIEDTLQTVQKRNAAVEEDNRLLREKIAELQHLGASRGYRYVQRIDRDLLKGNLRGRFGILGHAIGESRALLRLATELLLPPPPPPPPEPELPRPAALTERPDNLKIAFSLIGGMGDMLWLTTIVNAIKRKYLRSDIVLFVDKCAHLEVFANNPCVAETIQLDSMILASTVRKLLESSALDMWFECHYATKVHYGPNARVRDWEKRATDEAFAACELNFDQFPHGNNMVSMVARRKGQSMLQLVADSCALELGDPQLSLYPSYEDLGVTTLLDSLGDYITIHHGADRNMAGRGGTQTKNWFPERWEAVIAHLKRTTNLQVLQLGTHDDVKLEGAMHFFMGKTNVRESGVILQRARFHLDTEGGLVHLARAVHTPSLVLFGPTPVEFFGYPQNVNLRAGDCHDCWWSTNDWSVHCPIGQETPSCMDHLERGQVLREVDAMVRRTTPKPRRHKLEDFTFFDGAMIHENEPMLKSIYRSAQLAYHGPARHSMNDETGAYVHGSKNWEYLYAVKQMQQLSGGARMRVLDVGAGRGALSMYLADQGHESHICDLGWSVHSHTGREYEPVFLEAIRNRVRARFGTAFNLPYESGTFDAVVCISVVEHLQYKHVALGEMLRVLKPGGMLVLTFDVLPRPDDLQRFTDWNRIEIFTEKKIVADLAALGIDYQPDPAALERSYQGMRTFGIDGIPDGLTVGGLVIRKEALAAAEDAPIDDATSDVATRDS